MNVLTRKPDETDEAFARRVLREYGGSGGRIHWRQVAGSADALHPGPLVIRLRDGDLHLFVGDAVKFSDGAGREIGTLQAT